ncbi:hypothetical protein OIU84_028074 [Salix udensis]|uniref:Ubiquitin-like domain-containing protein n=1 Tax=Salix udensis TaxID=889485 RepID=A0AAD6KDY3_9ROSI|nr:hypothetical protein OIU84_028074 [Salix udensis]
MKVIVVAGAREFLLEIGLQDSVLDIKRRIQQLVGVPVAAQILAVSDWELIDGLDMEDYPIVIDGTRKSTFLMARQSKGCLFSFLGWNLMKILATSVYKCS